ncbi:MAG TPA: CheR family methyltransferase [Dinghuibacter sp.]|uniref:CheR family methyltransferase n=1 Tax=Dinghuibacter sp. TaxID=2024697 RepID=UPI002CF97A11|nr:CheR family methyltransferase [Dinghuibacter sp.]HTJ11851.1 CheR family methyltransferase [Dinghuibacter sp.]
MTVLKDKDRERSSNLFPVVGIGASAGGLDAFKRLVRSIPGKSGIAYILVQHLEPNHESLLVDILQKDTVLPVEEIVDNVRIEPDHIYVIPSNRFLAANDGRLELTPRPPRGERNMAIDVFFSSLAEVYLDHAIGVVLSGTGTDGTLGLKAIKDHGGITFVQDPASAVFGGMPDSVIEAGMADFVLIPEEMPSHLIKLFGTLKIGLSDATDDTRLAGDRLFGEVLSIVRVRTGMDFTYYKQTTIRRRIIRRMGLNKIDDIAGYLEFLKEHVQEQDLLYQDLLIPVTGFFRDPGTFDLLRTSVFPNLLKGKGDSNPIRIWVAGCSTGEEAYSIAICLNEYLGERSAEQKVQIFATDISDRCITAARSGIYAKRDMSGLTAAHVARYFKKMNGAFQVNKGIRDMCVFASHNFLKDPPFAKMDLVSCRNVLIYMESFLQKRALTTFHYALKEDGYLLLGRSETVAPASDLFAVSSKSDKIYVRKAVPGRLLRVNPGPKDTIAMDRGPETGKDTGKDDFQKSADELILSRFAPPGIIINEQLEIVQFRGSTGIWLEPLPGKPSLNVFKMVRTELSFELRNAIRMAKKDNTPAVKENIPVLADGERRWVTIEAIPLANTAEPYFLILFREAAVSAGGRDDARAADPGTRIPLKGDGQYDRNQQLEKELAQLREDMRVVAEVQESVNRELQSANEELLSGNEELQSLNEELETSKEEIQSSNEELTTLNQELTERNEQLNMSRVYAESIVATIREPLIILNGNMRVKTANPSYYRKFMTSEEDTEGKSFFTLSGGQWDLPSLRLLLEKIPTMASTVTDFEVKLAFRDIGERSLLLNACQVARLDNEELLILLAIEDVTEARKREEDLLLFSQELERKVAERTASLLEANSSLKQSNENLEQFATIASHDLQEPLRKIQTFSALLDQRYGGAIAGDAGDLIRKIDMAARRMSALIRDVLHFSKILDAGERERVDLDVILRDVIGDFDVLIDQKGASVTHDRLPAIRAVPLQMNQLFYNLLGNALKFSGKDVAPVIEVIYGVMSSDGVKRFPALDGKLQYCEIIFRDNGIGIDQRFFGQIFEVFQRLNGPEYFEGTGIGLALCKKIVLSHKGEIFVVSKEGSGSEFHVILPLES